MLTVGRLLHCCKKKNVIELYKCTTINSENDSSVSLRNHLNKDIESEAISFQKKLEFDSWSIVGNQFHLNVLAQ
jgi:hypothetical protein